MAASNAVLTAVLIALGAGGEVLATRLATPGPRCRTTVSYASTRAHGVGKETPPKHGRQTEAGRAGRASGANAGSAIADVGWGALQARTVAARSTQSSRPADAADIDAESVAAYRLREPVFARFEAASRRIAVVTRDDPRYANAPLFSREVAMLGDVRAVAAGLQARLQNDPALAGALTAAKITAPEYTTFAIALIAARLAQGFVAAGVLRNVPPGPTSDNVAFVTKHEVAVSSVLADLGVNGLPDAAR